MGKGTLASVPAPGTDVLAPPTTMPRLAVWADWDFFAVHDQGPHARSEKRVTGKARHKVDGPAATKKSVLVVDDDRDVRTMLRTQLEIEGYTVIEAADGNEAWELIQRQHPAVVIADVLMPGQSGLDLCRQARAAGFNSTGFIAFTAGLASYEECSQAGFDARLLKTDPLPRLSETVRRLLSR